MTNKVTKYGLMTIAAVLLVAMAFAGAGAATTHIVSDETELLTAFANVADGDIVSLSSDIDLAQQLVLDKENTAITLVGNGHTVYRAVDNCFLVLIKNGTLTLGDKNSALVFDGRNDTYSSDNNYGLFGVEAGARLFMNDLVTLQNSYALKTSIGRGGGVYVYDSGYFQMDGGLITQCKVGKHGGAIATYGSSVMNGGEIVGCSALGNAGAVMVPSSVNGGSFTMNGGIIRDCLANGYGGAVVCYNNLCKFTMNGGKIINCNETSGFWHLSIALENGARITISGGYISNAPGNNTICQRYTAAGNKPLEIFGNPVIIDPISIYNAYLGINVSGPITDGASIRNISTSGYVENDIIVNVTYAGGTASSVAKYFDVDSDSYYLVPNTDVDDSKLLLASVPAGSSKVSFYDGSNKLAYQIVTNGATVTEPANPSKAGYTFNGWYADSGLTTPYDFTTPVTSTLYLYAKWSDPIEYTITYNLDGGSATNPSTYNVTTPTITLTDAYKLGYIFEGWYNNSAKSAEYLKNTIPTGSTENKEFWANYTGNVTTVIFHTDAETEDKLNTCGQETNFSVNPTRSGYTFSHWNVSSTGLPLTDSTYVDGGIWNYTGADQGTLDVYANWTVAPPQYTPSSSSKQTGSTVILSEGQVAPTAYATAAPTVAPTVKPTEKPATPTVIATEKPTTQATQSSPAPFVGILAGLGAAAVLLRLRK